MLADQHMHHAQGQRGVGPGHQREMKVTLLRGLTAVGIDRDQLGAAALRLLDPAPQMQIGYDRVRAPDEYQSRVLELLHIDADGGADGRDIACLAGGRADRAIEQRCAQLVKKASIHRAVLQQPHGARIAVRDDRLRTFRRRRNLGKALGDSIERRVPANASKLAVALFANALQRMQHASVGISALEVARDLGAQYTVGRRMLGIALDLDRASIFDRDMQGAGVGTVVRACAAHEGTA